MSRRDTIVIAVLLNVGLLAVLFMMAVNPDEERFRDHSDTTESFVFDHQKNDSQNNDSQKNDWENSETIVKNPARPSSQTSSPRDEIDSVLQHYHAQGPSQTLVLDDENENESEQKTSLDRGSSSNDKEHFVQVSVKRGDALEKIARANGTSVETLKKVNNLTSERLAIGQMLRIPLNKDETQTKTSLTKIEEKKPTLTTPAVEPEYYTIKSGDNPWKIAKQFHVKYDEILKLNHLDEEKARNLKIGDKVRVR